MKLKCIGCEVLARVLYENAATSPHVVDIELLQFGLHRTPKKLGETLQQLIYSSGTKGYDAVLLAYGLCGKATHSLRAGEVPLIIPRAHDCITLFLGSRERYLQEFNENPGTYWYVQDYIERDDGSGTSLSSGMDEDVDNLYSKYVEKYGKDNADYLMQVMGAWKTHYQRAAFIEMGVGDGENVKQKAKADAERRGWKYEQLEGKKTIIQRLLSGSWDRDFLVLQPGQSIIMTTEDDIITCAE